MKEKEYINFRNHNEVLLQEFCKNRYFVIKRIADIIFSSIILFLTFPILLVTSILIKMESKGPVFYIQERVGKDGKIFKLIKLRTMYIDKDVDNNLFCTYENDPRITKIGKIIRPCSLDEFPQFFNVLKGDLSYIGPRPISVEEHNFVLLKLQTEKKMIPSGLIHKAKPGITGWALLHGREKISYEDRFRLNTEYENGFSLFFDLKIFFMTFKKYALINFAVLVIFLAVILHLFSFIKGSL